MLLNNDVRRLSLKDRVKLERAMCSAYKGYNRLYLLKILPTFSKYKKEELLNIDEFYTSIDDANKNIDSIVNKMVALGYSPKDIDYLNSLGRRVNKISNKILNIII